MSDIINLRIAELCIVCLNKGKGDRGTNDLITQGFNLIGTIFHVSPTTTAALNEKGWGINKWRVGSE